MLKNKDLDQPVNLSRKKALVYNIDKSLSVSYVKLTFEEDVPIVAAFGSLTRHISPRTKNLLDNIEMAPVEYLSGIHLGSGVCF